MKKYLILLIIVAFLLCGCKNSDDKVNSSSVGASSEQTHLENQGTEETSSDISSSSSSQNSNFAQSSSQSSSQNSSSAQSSSHASSSQNSSQSSVSSDSSSNSSESSSSSNSSSASSSKPSQVNEKDLYIDFSDFWDDLLDGLPNDSWVAEDD